MNDDLKKTIITAVVTTVISSVTIYFVNKYLFSSNTEKTDKALKS